MKLQNTDLADNRFGNQIFQFFFLKLVEQHLGLRATCPPWVGEQLFALDFAQDCELPAIRVDLEPGTRRSAGYANELEQVRQLCAQTAGTVDIKGYFQYHSWQLRQDRALFLHSFAWREPLLHQIRGALQTLGLGEATTFVIGLHLRAGDYRQLGQFHPLFWMPSLDAYVAALQSLIDAQPQRRIIYLASDEAPQFRAQLAQRGLEVLTAAQLFATLTPVQAMLVDYCMLACSDAMVISNSSFSFSAAMRNERARIFLRPGTRNEQFIPFDPWNSQVLLPRSFGQGSLKDRHE